MSIECEALEEIEYQGTIYPEGFTIEMDEGTALKYSENNLVELPAGMNTKPAGPTKTKPEKPDEVK